MSGREKQAGAARGARLSRVGRGAAALLGARLRLLLLLLGLRGGI